MYDESRNPFFPVIKEKVQTLSGLDVGKFALINQETNDVLGLVGKDYEIIENHDVNELFMEAISDLGVSKTIDHLDSNTKRWKRHIVFDRNSLDFEVQPGDNVGVMLEIYNGLTGRTSFGYNLMGYRWLCENGMVSGKEKLFSESLAHYVGNPEKLRESFEMKFDLFRNQVDVWKEWVNVPFDHVAFDTFVNGQSYITEKVGKDIVDMFPVLLERQNLMENKWGAFNVLTNIATHETKARRGSNVFSNRYNNVNRLAADLYHWEDKLAA